MTYPHVVLEVLFDYTDMVLLNQINPLVTSGLLKKWSVPSNMGQGQHAKQSLRGIAWFPFATNHSKTPDPRTRQKLKRFVSRFDSIVASLKVRRSWSMLPVPSFASCIRNRNAEVQPKRGLPWEWEAGRTYPLQLVAVDPSAKSLSFCGFNGKPLISPKVEV